MSIFTLMLFTCCYSLMRFFFLLKSICFDAIAFEIEKLWQLTFLEKRTETTYDAESTNKFSDEFNKELTDETGCFNFFNLRTKIWWASIRFRGFCDYSTRQGDSTNFWSNKGIKDVINRKVRGSTRDCFDKYSRCSWMTCKCRVGWWCN